MSKLEVTNNELDGTKEQRIPSSHDEKVSASHALYESARLGELLPGIIHNLSTPLSGVIGGIQLLETRSLSIAEAIEKLDESTNPQWREVVEQLKRNQKNIELISRNAESLTGLLRNIVTRINRSSLKTPDIYSINQLVEMELRFLESDLTFKHRVKRSIQLVGDLPALRCIYSVFAEAFDEIIYTAMKQRCSQQDSLLEMLFSTETRAAQLVLNINCDIEHAHFENNASTDEPPVLSRPTLQEYFERLREDNWEVEIRASDMGTLFELRHAPVRLASRK